MGLSGAGVHLNPAGLSEGIRNKYLQTGHSLTVNCGVDRCNVANYCTLIMSLSMLKKISEWQRHPTSERSEDAASAGGTPGRAAQPPARGGARGAQRGGPGRGASAVWWGALGGDDTVGGEVTGAGPGRPAASRAGRVRLRPSSGQTSFWRAWTCRRAGRGAAVRGAEGAEARRGGHSSPPRPPAAPGPPLAPVSPETRPQFPVPVTGQERPALLSARGGRSWLPAPRTHFPYARADAGSSNFENLGTLNSV